MFNKVKSVILFALARTGSHSLCDILNQHGSLRFINEPFNKSNPYYFPINDEEDVDRSLREILTQVNAIKHVWDPSGWPFKDTGLNRKLVQKFDQVILLARRSVFDRIVSAEICRQSKVWHIWEEHQRKVIDDLDYGPLNEAVIRWHVENEYFLMEECKSLLDSKGICYYCVYYEDIFQDEAFGMATINKILEFLGLPAFAEGDRARIRPILDSGNKIATERVLSRIPNYQELRGKYAELKLSL
jgi:LPS sulfotransferase NodH